MPGPALVVPAHVVHAAAALYLGLGGRDLRDALAMGLSLTDLAECRGRSLAGLKRALLRALERTGGRGVPGLPAIVERLVDVAAAGSGVWQAAVERVVDVLGRRPWPLAATAA